MQKERDELQRQYSSLLSDSERLSDELHEKAESFMVLSESHAQTKADLGALVAVKVDMEQKLHKALEDLERMTNKVEAAQNVSHSGEIAFVSVITITINIYRFFVSFVQYIKYLFFIVCFSYFFRPKRCGRKGSLHWKKKIVA